MSIETGWPASVSLHECEGKLARLRVSCVHSEAIHKATSEIVAKAKPHSMRPCVIGVEDLNVSGMMKNHRLARAVADASMREFRRQLAYKCAWYVIELVVVPRSEATSTAVLEVRPHQEGPQAL